MITDLQIAKEWLNKAIDDKNSESAIREYIRFMDNLLPWNREAILLNPDITKLIDIINGRL